MTGHHEQLERARSRIVDWYRQGLDAVDPRLAVQKAVGWTRDALTVDGQVVAVPHGAHIVGISFGKAASTMAAGLSDVLGDGLTAGVILTKDGHASDPPDGWTVFEASHPVPDDRGVEATRYILDAVAGLDGQDVVVVLVSGGGSALLEAPRSPLTLADIQAVTSALLRAGAPIQDLNAVRSELSQVKGGGLRRAIGNARCVSLILSDVLGNDPRVIASGPTVPRQPDPGNALALLEAYGVIEQVPQAVVDLLNQAQATAAAATAPDDIFAIVGDNEIFVDAIAVAADNDGFRTSVALRRAEGEARDLAKHFLATTSSATLDGVDVVLGGGEATVTVRGDGSGGRNTEFALSAALELARTGSLPLVIASLASDGQDGSVDAAGAIADPYTVTRAVERNLDPLASLESNDSGGFFAELGELVVPGPTGTNVNDVYIALRLGATGSGERSSK